MFIWRLTFQMAKFILILWFKVSTFKTLVRILKRNENAFKVTYKYQNQGISTNYQNKKGITKMKRKIQARKKSS